MATKPATEKRHGLYQDTAAAMFMLRATSSFCASCRCSSSLPLACAFAQLLGSPCGLVVKTVLYRSGNAKGSSLRRLLAL